MIHLGAIWISFETPAWLLAGFAALLPAALAWRYRGQGNRKRWFIIALQSLALLLAAISLAGPVVPFSMRTPKWLILRDISASVGKQSNVELNLPADVEVEQKIFAGRILSHDEHVDLDATNLRPVLEWSTAAIEAGQADGAILLTDGQFQDDWKSAARSYAQRSAPLWIVPLDTPSADARIATFTATPKVNAKQSRVEYDLAVTLQSNAPMRRTLGVFRFFTKTLGKDKRKLGQSDIVLEPNRPATIHMRDILPADSAAIWQAELSPHDALPQNDTLQTTHLPWRVRVAWIASAGNVLKKPLSNTAVVSLLPTDAPTDLTGWLGYNAVVLADATGALLSHQQRTALVEYVRSGGGLVLLGAGPHDKPADRDDPLNRILPLRANPFERQPLSLTVVLDASGSMAQAIGSPARMKWSLAGEATLALRDHLTPADRLRVIVFSDDAQTIYESRQAGPDFSKLAEVLQTISPNGSTNIAPALEQTTQTLPVNDATNLVLVLSDLQTATFNPAAMAKRFTQQGRKLAVIATGSADVKTTPLAQLATQIRAPLVYREHLQGLADVFARLCRQARGEAIRRGDFTIRYDDLPWLKTVPLRQLSAYIPAAVVGDAHVDARIESTGDPFMAGDTAGLGRVAVLSAPSEAILSKPGGETLVERWIRRTARGNGDPKFDVQVTRGTQEITVRVIARDGETPINNLTLFAEALNLDDVSAKPILKACLQSAPGEYQAEIPLRADTGQPLAVQILASQRRRIWQGIAPRNYPAEFASLGANYEKLRELANITGGRILDASSLSSPEMQNELRQPRHSGRGIWPVTLTFALIFMLAGWLAGGFLRRKKSM